ncbi:chromate transporter [Clostridium estertheticum]|uniref:Chromate transporter n=1 Tax=Clostridium estertheticum TaxID=238834 RepID=A0AA47I5C7_9CLOT|nr:chromate transporter [Clostridium estertheticum]MBU3154358.1 chromate transporter [Clostridium estertheticum]MBU3197875.1 chromate transporter [Clostridium estertheticum]WAG60247.1 chromate transporter [Clostridium estertheticum]WAG65675.1 chromate transporter [Clostridium estertheticum]
MIYLKIFWSFFQIGLFSVGGGYAAMPLIQNQVVTIHSWLSMNEFADVITISQMTPGPIAINCATFVGTRIAGVPGAIVATIGCVFPSCVIVLFLAYLYYKYKSLFIVQGVLNGLRPAVIAMIGSAGLILLILAFWNGKGISSNTENIDGISVGLFTIAIIILRKWKVNPIFIMIGSGVLGLCIYSFYHSVL